MTTAATPTPAPADAPAPTPSPAADGARTTRAPLTPAHVGASIGEDPDPEQDIAANLGGESNMQDA